jgi:tripartite-type tricarboxylate transporter receptor subunit TctC
MRIVSGFAAGGATDVMGRLVAEYIRQHSGTTVIVENRPGGGGRIAAAYLAHLKTDEPVVLLAPIVTTAFTPFMYKKSTYDALKDLKPITRLGNFKFALAVNKDIPVKTVQEFVDYVKAHPGTISFSTPGAGTPAEFLGKMFNRSAGTDMVHVPYRGSGLAAAALVGGQVQASFNTTASLVPLYKDGKIKLLAVTGTSRSPTLPDVPSFRELQLDLGDIVKADLWYGFLAPGTMTPETAQKVNNLLVAALKDPKTRERLTQLDIEVVTDTPEEFATIVKQDYDRWGKVIKESGFKLRD